MQFPHAAGGRRKTKTERADANVETTARKLNFRADGTLKNSSVLYTYIYSARISNAYIHIAPEERR